MREEEIVGEHVIIRNMIWTEKTCPLPGPARNKLMIRALPLYFPMIDYKVSVACVKVLSKQHELPLEKCLHIYR